MQLVASLKRAQPLAIAAAVILICAADGYAGDSERSQWVFRTRAVLSGNSHDSDPADFVAYSGLALEAGVTRKLSRVTAAEVSLRTESREVDREIASGPALRLGSIEVLPLTAVLQYRPEMPGSLHPYIGVGTVLSITWEKSGVLDSLDVGTYLGPALQLGLDHDLGPAAVVNLDLRWHTFAADIENGENRFAEILIDPMVMGIGVGFRF